MLYSTFKKNKDYSMTYIVPAFEKYAKRDLVVENGNLKLNQYGQYEKVLNKYAKYANALAFCGVQKRFQQCVHDGAVHFDGFNACRNRYCPVCQRLKSMVLFAKLYPKIDRLIKTGHIVKMLTFTIKDTDRLKDGVNLIKKAFRVFSNGNKKYRKVFESLYIGGIKSLEVKRGENSNQWHPHIHALVISKKPEKDFIPINIMWNKTLIKLVNSSDKQIYENKVYNDTFNIVYDKLVLKDKLGFVRFDSLKDMDIKSRIHTVYECIKYITKYSDNLMDDLPEIVDSVSNIRTVESWGIIRGIESSAELEDGLTPTKVKDKVCAVCGEREFIELNNCTLKDLRESYCYDGEIYDFNTYQNKMEKEHEF